MFIKLFQHIDSYLHFPGDKTIDLPELIINNFDKFLIKNSRINGFILKGKKAFSPKKNL